MSETRAEQRDPGALKAFDRLSAQPKVEAFLRKSAAAGQLSHAYLFVGAPGSGMEDAALALAQALVCPDGGCGACDECIRVAHRTHPDVHWYQPASTTGYMIDQVRAWIEDVNLSSVRGRGKVYIVAEAERLWGQTANALLKTIEEPPEDVTFILLARTQDAVLSTIVSRCQVVPFRAPSSQAALLQLCQRTGVDEARARIALAICGGVDAAERYFAEPRRSEVRRRMLSALRNLSRADACDILQYAQDITEGVQDIYNPKPKTKEEKKQAERAEAEDDRARLEYLSDKGLREAKAAEKRGRASAERSGMIEAINCCEAVLRDALLVSQNSNSSVINTDAEDLVARLAQAGPASCVHALQACAQAADDVRANVAPRLAFECMLLRMKEEF